MVHSLLKYFLLPFYHYTLFWCLKKETISWVWSFHFINSIKILILKYSSILITIKTNTRQDFNIMINIIIYKTVYNPHNCFFDFWNVNSEAQGSYQPGEPGEPGGFREKRLSLQVIREKAFFEHISERNMI